MKKESTFLLQSLTLIKIGRAAGAFQLSHTTKPKSSQLMIIIVQQKNFHLILF